MNYWIIVASTDHLGRGLAGGFIQAEPGKATPLKRMPAGAWVIFSSPKLEFEKLAKLHGFTAICRMVDENINQPDRGPDSFPSAEKYNSCP